MKSKQIVKVMVPSTAAVLVVYIFWDKIISLGRILEKGTVQQTVDMIRSWGFAAPLLSILLMIFQSLAAPIPSFLISAANGAVFGLFWGVVISWIGAMAGGIIAFLLSRWLGAAFVMKVVKNKRIWDQAERISRDQGFKIVLIARLLPFVSFDFISYAAGLGRIKLIPFLAATGIGMIPSTIIYVLLGERMLKLEDLWMLLSLVTAGIILLAGLIRYLLKAANKSDGKEKYPNGK
jgi:uncharacterized membrane protein YdjX (TVP38/TMEM64 family)